MKVAMIGGGYVGLVSAACLAHFGHEVVCIERDAARIAALERGELPFYEPGLAALLAETRAGGTLRFSAELAGCIEDREVAFIAVGTPARARVRRDVLPARAELRAQNGLPASGSPKNLPPPQGADLSDVEAAVDALAAVLPEGCVVAMKSTVPVGTADAMEARIAAARPGLEFAMVSNPEFLRQGEAIRDFIQPERIVVGAASEQGRAAMERLYHPFGQREIPLVFTDRRSAELSKYAANVFLAGKLALIGEVADLCEAGGGDVEVVARVLGGDARIGAGFLRPGPGFGGSCLPKDGAALVSMAREHGVACHVIEAILASNEARKSAMTSRIVAAGGGTAKGMRVGVLGVTFKPETDDMRDAPALTIVPALQAAAAEVRAYDPRGMAAAARLLPGVAWASGAKDALRGADVGVVLTEWREFRSLDLAELRGVMRGDALVDLRNVYRREEAAAAGFVYHSIGRGDVP